MIPATTAELERLGYKVNGNTWQWNIYPIASDHKLVYVSDGQESAQCDDAALADQLAQCSPDWPDEERRAEIWARIAVCEVD